MVWTLQNSVVKLNWEGDVFSSCLVFLFVTGYFWSFPCVFERHLSEHFLELVLIAIKEIIQLFKI